MATKQQKKRNDDNNTAQRILEKTEKDGKAAATIECVGCVLMLYDAFLIMNRKISHKNTKKADRQLPTSPTTTVYRGAAPLSSIKSAFVFFFF